MFRYRGVRPRQTFLFACAVICSLALLGYAAALGAAEHARRPPPPRPVIKVPESSYVPHQRSVPAAESQGKGVFFQMPPQPGSLFVACDVDLAVTQDLGLIRMTYNDAIAPGAWVSFRGNDMNAANCKIRVIPRGRPTEPIRYLFVDHAAMLAVHPQALYQIDVPADKWSTAICFPPLSPGGFGMPSGPMRYLINEWFETEDWSKWSKGRIATLRLRSLTGAPATYTFDLTPPK